MDIRLSDNDNNKHGVVTSNAASSFRLANDQPYVFKNYEKANLNASSTLKSIAVDLDKDAEEIIHVLAGGKRKRNSDIQNPNGMKRPRSNLNTKTPTASTSFDVSLTRAHLSPDTYDDNDEEVEWSDCDESEMSKLLEKSVHQDLDGPKNSSLLAGLTNIDDVDEDDWSDCDELELSRNVSLLERSIKSPNAKQDRSALLEISNLSNSDQS